MGSNSPFTGGGTGCFLKMPGAWRLRSVDPGHNQMLGVNETRALTA